MKARQIIRMLPESVLLELSKKHKADYKVKKLPAIFFFKTIVKSLFSGGKTTLKALAVQFESQQFQKFALQQKEYTTIHPTAFCYRFNKIPAEFFRDLFEAGKEIYLKRLKNKEKYDTWIFDSTIVSLSEKQLKNCGYQIKGSERRKQLKYTVGLKNGFPEKINFYCNKRYNSEDRALGETILETDIRKNSIILFDRGLKKRNIFDQLTYENLFFISRLKKSYKMKIVSQNTTPSKNKDIIKEQEGYLYGKGHKITTHIYRTIHIKSPNESDQKAVIDKKTKTQANAQLKSKKNVSKTKEELIQDLLTEDIIIITNIPRKRMTAEEVAEKYRERWKIETFFKFIKQELNFSHLINRTENGIKSMLYIIMLCALMLLVYKKENKLSGYKFVKKQFMSETEVDLVIEAFKKAIDLLKSILLIPAQFW